MNPIIITGCGRSGGSMMAGVVNICGAFGGKVNDHYENIGIQEQIIRPYLKSLNVDVNGQYPLPQSNKLHIPAHITAQVNNIMRQDGYKDGPWYIKGSLISLTWPIWHYAYPKAKWVIIRRRTGGIISSCLKTNYMDAFRDPTKRDQIGAKTEQEGWKWWVRQYERRFVDMITEGINCQVVWPERMIYGDYQQMFTIIDWLGLKWKSEALTFVDPKFWKSRIKNKISSVSLET